LSWSPLETTQTGNDYLIHENIIYLGGEGMYTTPIENPFITGNKEIPEYAKNHFCITPNPAKEFVTIKFENGKIEKSLIQIFSLDGVLMKSISTYGNTENIIVSITGFPEGLYYVIVTGENIVDVNSFVKLN